MLTDNPLETNGNHHKDLTLTNSNQPRCVNDTSGNQAEIEIGTICNQPENKNKTNINQLVCISDGDLLECITDTNINQGSSIARNNSNQDEGYLIPRKHKKRPDTKTVFRGCLFLSFFWILGIVVTVIVMGLYMAGKIQTNLKFYTMFGVFWLLYIATMATVTLRYFMQMCTVCQQMSHNYKQEERRRSEYQAAIEELNSPTTIEQSILYYTSDINRLNSIKSQQQYSIRRKRSSKRGGVTQSKLPPSENCQNELNTSNLPSCDQGETETNLVLPVLNESETKLLTGDTQKGNFWSTINANEIKTATIHNESETQAIFNERESIYLSGSNESEINYNFFPGNAESETNFLLTDVENESENKLPTVPPPAYWEAVNKL